MNNHQEDSFKMIYKNCGHGGSGKISVVKRKSDGKLFIWKRPKSSSPRYQVSYQKEIKKIKLWKKFGVSKVKVNWHPDNKSLIKTYIKGPTLKQVLKQNPRFFSEIENESRKALIEFIELLIDSKYYIHDLKGANLIFDGNRWHIIDSGPAYKRKSRSAIRHEYKKNLFEKWSRGLRSKEDTKSLKLFLDKYCH